MRAAGIVVLLLALALLGRGLFALAWDAGTPRTADDWLLIALAALLLTGGGAMTADRSWGWKLSLAIVVLLGAVAIFQAFSRVRIADNAAQLALHELPEWTPRPEMHPTLPPREWARARSVDPQWRAAIAGFEARIAATLGDEWWATPVEKLHAVRRENDAIARDWEIQGDQRTRLIVLKDPYLEIESGRLWPLNAFLLVNAGKNRIAREVIDGFYTADRDSPITVRLRSEGDRQIAIVVARSDEACSSKTYALDPRAGTMAQIEDAPSACP